MTVNKITQMVQIDTIKKGRVLKLNLAHSSSPVICVVTQTKKIDDWPCYDVAILLKGSEWDYWATIEDLCVWRYLSEEVVTEEEVLAIDFLDDMVIDKNDLHYRTHIVSKSDSDDTIVEEKHKEFYEVEELHYPFCDI